VVGYGDGNGAPPDEGRKCNGAWFPLHFSRLGGRVHAVPERGVRGSTCPCDREQGRSGLPAWRPVRQASQVDGGLGCVLRDTKGGQDRGVWTIGTMGYP